MLDPVTLAAGASIGAAVGNLLRGSSKSKRNSTLARRTMPAGASPGTLIAPDNAAATSVEVIRFSSVTHDVFSNPTLDDLAGWTTDESHVTWVHVRGLADVPRLQTLGERFGFHRLLLEDIVNVGHRPKVEHYDRQMFLIMRLAPKMPGDAMDQLSIVHMGNTIFTFDERPGDCFDTVRGRLAAGGQLRALGAVHLLLAIMDAAIDAYFPTLEAEGGLLDVLEDRVLEPRATAVFAETTEVKRRLLSYRRALWPMRELVGALLRDEDANIPANSRPYLRDIYDHCVELVDLVEVFRETATSLSELHLAMVSARMNDVMRFLTIISTIFMPLTFIAGLYGMNFRYMPELNWRPGYFVVLGLMALVTLGLIAWFKYHGLLGRPGKDPALVTRKQQRRRGAAQ
jgi:magnesium transporter